MSRRTAVRRVGWLVLLANLALVAAKTIAWWWSGSLAVGSEAVNSFSDSIYSLVVLAGLYLTTRPPDYEHPHGHERIEPFVGLFVAFVIGAAGAGVLWRAVQGALAGGGDGTFGAVAVGVLVVTTGVKYGLYRFVRRVGEARNSPALVATAIDNRNDVFTASAALVGVIGARLGAPVLDPLAAMVVSIGIFYTGWTVARENVTYLTGRAPPEDLREEILRRAVDHPDVEGAHDVVAHYVGPEVDVSLHIEVQGDRTLREAHAIESEVVQSIRVLPGIDDVFVHVDPRELDEWKRDEEVDRLLDGDRDDRTES